ncbi:hypothetical protein [Edaphocola aurantiacus]|uniref:hypothetical protein n=1 Tax=Edaphocola aurantiacus TaxID=2601682 RepID=UPI001C94992C|nr:hypothetical protein [Edaphocola aurantiacus]
MKIELKKIEFSERMSQETNCFTANLYIDGKYVGEASNTGIGGPTDYESYSEEGRALIKKAEEYCKGLPSETFESGGQTYTLKMSLESYIDDLMSKYLKEQQTKKLLAKMKQHIVFSRDVSVYYQTLRLPQPIDQMLSNQKGRNYIQLALLDIEKQLKDGEKILNPNIPVQQYRDFGIKEGSYQPMEIKSNIKPEATKKKGKSL